MRSTATVLTRLFVVLCVAVVGYRMFFSSGPEAADRGGSVDAMQSVAKDGMDYLIHLRLEGRLPGITTNEHGTALIRGRLDAYPFLLSARFSVQEASVTDHYNIVQIDKGSPWKLERAWQTDSEGRIVQEWPVKPETKPDGRTRS